MDADEPRPTGQLRELSEADCWIRLAERPVGRLAYNDRNGPVIVPLNYVVHDGRIWIRTASYNQLAINLPGQSAAFEVDDVDTHAEAGWSVLVRGVATHETRMRTLPTWPEPEPWTEGVRTMVFSLRPTEITGRVLTQASVTPAAGSGPGSVQREHTSRR